MTDDDVERVARALAHEASTTEMGSAGFNARHRNEYVEICWRDHEDRARAALSAMPSRVSPDLIAQLNALASRLTQMGEYEACDLIDTVVARVTAMPQRELLAEALDALEPFANVAAHDIGDDETDRDTFRPFSNPKWARAPLLTVGDLRRARAAADKIRAALEHQP